MSNQLITAGNAGAVSLEMTETDDALTVVIDNEQPIANNIVLKGNQQASPDRHGPGLDDNDLEEDINGETEHLDQKISQSERAYSKRVGSIYKLLAFYAVMQSAILSAVFSTQKNNCKDSWGLLVLSAIVSGGVTVAFIREYFEQFRLLSHARILIEKRRREGIRVRSLSLSCKSGRSVSGTAEDDLDNLGGVLYPSYWRWTAERVAFLGTLIAFSICLWRSCKSRLLC